VVRYGSVATLRSRIVSAALIAAVTAGALAVGYRAGLRGERAKQADMRETLADTASVLVAVRGLARLESVAFHMERVIDLEQRQRRLFGLVDAKDAILLVAAGDVVAGIDLARMRDGDVIAEPSAGRVHVTLPPPEILWARLDNQRTYVHARNTDMLAEAAPALETRARKHAETAIRDAALEAGIVERARASAAHTVTVLVRSLGYDRVEIAWAGEGSD
jgi:hypothetical protein